MLSSSRWFQMTLRRETLRYLAYYFAIISLVMGGLTYAFIDVWHFDLPNRVYWIVLPLQAGLTGLAFLLSRRLQTVTSGMCLALLLASVAILGLYLHDSGGHTNPLISLLLVPLAMCAALLCWISTLILTVAAVGLYSVLTQIYLPLEHHESGHAAMMSMHLAGMWMTFGLSALVIVGLITPMSASMRRQREHIAQQREKMLRDERLVAMATFAASAAHQLGTPLSTLAVVTDDLRDMLSDRPDITQDLALMASQISLCKTTLRSMMRRAEDIRNGVSQKISIEDLVLRLKQQFNLLNPAHSLRLINTTLPEAYIKSDETLDQALLNLLDNAASVGSEDPTLEVLQKNQNVIFRIRDNGPGIPQKIKDRLGEPFVTSRPEGGGLGLGLFLSNATIHRLGGTLSLRSVEGGTLTEVSLPVYSITQDQTALAFQEGNSTR